MGTAWQMPLAVIGKPTGDGRQFDQGALTHRQLPLPLRYVASDSGGHANAVIVGHIAKVGKEKDGMLPAKGEFYDDESWPEDVRNAATAARMFTQNKVIGPSVDLDQMEAEHVPEPKAYAAWKKEQAGKLKAAKMAHAGASGSDCGCGTPVFAEEAYDGPRLKMVRAGRFASATLVHIPAFAELAGHAKLTPIDSSNPNVDGTTSSAMVAGALVDFDWALVDWDDKIENDAEMSISEDTSDDPVPNRAKAQARKRPKRDPETVKGSQDTQEMAQADGESDEEFAKRRLPVPTKQKPGGPETPSTEGEQGQGGGGIGGGTYADDDQINQEGREKMAALMAGAAPVAPPKEWFDDPKLTGPTPMHIGDDGRVYGHVAVWDTCHVGIGDSCVKPPKTATSYAYFHTGEVKTEDGSRVPVGRLTYGGGHAAPNLGYRAAAEHYDRTSNTGAYVRAGEDEHGIWVAGMLAPDADEAAVFKMRAAPLSGDWRRVGGNLEMVAALHVNTAGFPIPRVLTAGADQDAFSLVAAGALPRVIDADEAVTAAAPAPLDMDALGRAVARGMLAEQHEAKIREERAVEWAELVASATAEDVAADYDEVLSDLMVALVE
jgi:ketosteroid isomerase-like protein